MARRTAFIRVEKVADGSLDIYIPSEPPGPDKGSNWLPAPAGEFNLAMRIYSPRREVLDGTWTPPPVRRLPDRAGGRALQ
jgi:hypothetical protein